MSTQETWTLAQWHAYQNQGVDPNAPPDDKPKKKARYNVAQPTEVDGHRFPSGHEARRYSELKIAERAGGISRLQLQVCFPLVVNDVPIFPKGYYADFVYLEHFRDGTTKLVVEDAKGVITEKFAIKEKLMLACWNIKIRRIQQGGDPKPRPRKDAVPRRNKRREGQRGDSPVHGV